MLTIKKCLFYASVMFKLQNVGMHSFTSTDATCSNQIQSCVLRSVKFYEAVAPPLLCLTYICKSRVICLRKF